MNAKQVRLLKALVNCVHFISDQYSVNEYFVSMGVSAFQSEYSAFQLYSPSTEIAELMKNVVKYVDEVDGCLQDEVGWFYDVDVPHKAITQLTILSQQFSHSPNFRSVVWEGERYSFTPNQAHCVSLLWEAWENETPELGQDYLLDNLDISTDRLSHVFRDGKKNQHPAWGTMILRQGVPRASYRLSGY